MHPEIKQLCTAFKMLRKLSVHGIFVEYDLVWTMSFLEAAPSIELLHIQVIFQREINVDLSSFFLQFVNTFPCGQPG